MNLHTLPRTLYLTRHGQSDYNLLGKIGGDSGLTPAGMEYARRLAVFAKEYIAQEGSSNDAESGGVPSVPRPARLWTSTLRRTKETAQFIEHNTIKHTYDNGDVISWMQFRPMARRNLDELYAGTCDGMTYKEIEEVYPEEFERRQRDKLAYRYPRGKCMTHTHSSLCERFFSMCPSFWLNVRRVLYGRYTEIGASCAGNGAHS